MRPFVKHITDPQFSLATANPEQIANQLIAASGAYCAFCEAPLGHPGYQEKVSTSDVVDDYDLSSSEMSDDDLPVGYRFQATRGVPRARGLWENYLLCCTACTYWRDGFPRLKDGLEILRKEDKTDYHSICTALRDANTLSSDQVTRVRRAAIACMVWPDTSVDINGVVLELGIRTAELFTFEWSEQSPQQLMDRRLIRVPVEWQQLPWMNVGVSHLWVVPNESFLSTLADPDTITWQVTNTILNLNLNMVLPADANIALPDTSNLVDSRVAQRSVAYTTYLGLWKGLLTPLVERVVHQLGRNDPEFIVGHSWIQLNLRQYCKQIQSAGFWSVAAFALDECLREGIWAGITTDVRRNLLYDVLVQFDPLIALIFPDDAPEPVMVLPGTDVDRLPQFKGDSDASE